MHNGELRMKKTFRELVKLAENASGAATAAGAIARAPTVKDSPKKRPRLFGNTRPVQIQR